MATGIINKCPRQGCGGVIIDSMGEAVCNLCGRPAPEPEKATVKPAASEPVPGDKVKLTPAQKAAIARQAQERGIKTVATEKGIPWKVVRAWIGAYTRKAPENHLPQKNEPRVLPPFPYFYDGWPVEVQMKWLETYYALAMLFFNSSPPEN